MSIDRRDCIGLLAAGAVVPAALAEPAKTRTIALLFDSLISPFWIASLERMRRYIQARGWSVLEAVSNMDDNRQYQQVKSAIQRGADGIIMVHTDDKAVVPAIRAANAANVPLIHFNRPPAPNDAYSVAVVADNRKLMDECVTEMISIARAQGGDYRVVVLLGDLADANAVHRREGLLDAVSRSTDTVSVVARVATEWNADKAFAGLTNALRAHPDINMLVTSSDFLTPQIEQALRGAGKWHRAGEPGHVYIASFDGDANAYEQLAAGYYDAVGVQDLDYEVDEAFRALEQMWAGERPPKTILDPGFVITRQTLSERRDRMWGYGAWQAKTTSATSGTVESSVGESKPSLIGPGTPPISIDAASAAGQGAKWAVFIAGLLAFTQAMFSGQTLHDVLIAMLPLAILVAGQMLVLVLGQIDLSMTAVMAMGSMASSVAMTRNAESLGEPAAVAVGICTCLAIGCMVGLFNGVCNAILRVPSFIITLAVMMAGSGAAVWYASAVSDSVSIGGLPTAFTSIGYGTAVGIPIALIIAVVVLLAIHYGLARTLLGRWLYAVGHNQEAARIAGVPVRWVTVAAFTASGMCAALATVIYTSRVETGLPTLGQNMLLDIVGAAIIGGISLFGGRGSIWMALAGVVFLSVLDKSLQLLGLSLFIVLAVKGFAILAAAMFDVARARRAGRV